MPAIKDQFRLRLFSEGGIVRLQWFGSGWVLLLVVLQPAVGLAQTTSGQNQSAASVLASSSLRAAIFSAQASPALPQAEATRGKVMGIHKS